MTARFNVVTGEGRTYGPFSLRELHEFVDGLPAWICWQAVVVGA